MMGFTKLMMAFYDQPELLHAINTDLLEFNLGLLDQIAKIGCRECRRRIFASLLAKSLEAVVLAKINNRQLLERSNIDRLVVGTFLQRPVAKNTDTNVLVVQPVECEGGSGC